MRIRTETETQARHKQNVAGFVLRAAAMGVLMLLLAVATTACRKKTPDEKFQEAQELFQEGKVVNAVLKAKELIKEHPDDPAAYEARIQLAFYYLQTGDPERAHEYLKEVYEGLGVRDPRGFGALELDLRIYRMQEQVDSGLQLIDSTLEILPQDSPTSAQLNLIKADFLLQTDDPATGEALYREIMLTSPIKGLRDQAREMLAQHFRETGEWEEMIKVYDDFVEAYPDTDLVPHFDVVRGIAKTKIGKEQEGLAQFEKGIEALKGRAAKELEKESAAEQWLTIAKYYLLAEKTDEAEETLAKVREEYPETQGAVQAGLLMGDLRVQQNRLDDAIEIYEQVRQDHPLSSGAQQAARRIQMVQQIQQEAAATTGTLTQEAGATTPTMTGEETPRTDEGDPAGTAPRN